MAVEIRIVGFGEDRPPRFGLSNRLSVDIDTPATVRALLRAIDVEEAADLIVMDTETVIPAARWDEPLVEDRASLTLLSAIEGG